MPRPTNRLARFLRRLKWFVVVYIWPEHETKIQTLNGLLSFNSKDKTLGRLLYLDREFEFAEMQELYTFLNERHYLRAPSEGTVLDVGGYIGMISTGFLLSGMFKEAITIEPNPNNFQMIEQNIKQNHLAGRMHAFNLALSDCDDVLVMELSKKNYGDHRIRTSTGMAEEHFHESARKTISVRSQTFDDFLAAHTELKPESISLVWMDIQGHEGKFIAGARGFFKQYKHVPIVMEFWPYAIKRSGLDKNQFVSIVCELFNSVILLDGDNVVMPINALPAYFDRFDGPENGAHIILLNV